MQADSALEFKDITYSLPERNLLAGFSLSLQPGEKKIICGDSGCGKSTLLKIATGLIAANSGEVIIGGTPLTEKNLWQLRAKISYVQQQNPLCGDTVEHFLQLPFTYKINSHLEYDHSMAIELAQTFRLKENILTCRPRDLSGGERQRISIISGLLLKREILLLDEPCTGLDPKSAENLISYLKERDDLAILAIAHFGQTFELTDQVTRLHAPHTVEA